VVGVGNSQYNGEVPISTTLVRQLPDDRPDARHRRHLWRDGHHQRQPRHQQRRQAVHQHQQHLGRRQAVHRGGSTTNANGQTAAVNAMWGLMNTYDALKNVLGWQSLDGNNTATYIAAHVNTAYDNAYYSDTCKLHVHRRRRQRASTASARST
jgi:hypothetical protein